MGEETPLIAGVDGGLASADANIIRRRLGPQHYQDGVSYAPSIEEFDKEDRRSLWGKISSFFSNGPNYSTVPTSDQRREIEEHYIDTYNDEPWSCSFGTSEDDGIWLNRRDQPGMLMSFTVWLLITYSAVTVTLLAHHNHLPAVLAMVYCTICALALASHAKTMFTDPGAVPQSAVPCYDTATNVTTHAMCSHCLTFKPTTAHHCRICNRCISRMDHHCPWMNNCVGAGNLKHFILFLCYTWTGCAFALLIFAWNYFLCSKDTCEFSVVLVQLVRAMTIICIGALLFTSSMLMNVTYGIMTGIGTIDRLKKKATNTLYTSEEEPVPLEYIFGIQGHWTWWLPIDPVFQDFDKVSGYSTPQRLLREQMRNSESSVGGARARKGFDDPRMSTYNDI